MHNGASTAGIRCKRAERRSIRCSFTPKAKASSTTSGRSRRCSASTATACRRSSSATAARSAAKRTCRSRPKLRSWPGSPAGRSSSRSRGRESFHIHPKRHPIELKYKIGCDAEGRITAVQARIIGDKGAYASVGAKVLERAGGHCTGPYRVPAIDMESLAVYTNNPPCGAMRGFGANQAAFAIEGLLDRLAEKVGIDGYDIRDRNILEPGEAFATGQIARQAVRPAQNAGGGERRLQEREVRRHRLRHQERRHRQRHAGYRQARPSPSKTTTRSTSAPASPKWARGCSRFAFNSPSKRPACRPTCSAKSRPIPS